MSNSNKGFTLLELLLAISLLAVIVVILFGALRLGLNSVKKAEARIEEIDRIRSVYLNLQRQISSIIPATRDNNQVWFTGQRDFMNFLSTVSLWGNREGLFEITYRVEDTDSGLQLIEEERLPGEEEGISVVVLENIEEIGFFYLNSEYEWTQEIQEAGEFPILISIFLIRNGKAWHLTYPVYATIRTPSATLLKKGVDIFESFQEFFR